MKPEEKQLLIVVARAVLQCAQWGQNTGINQDTRTALSAALARVTSPSHVEQTPAGCIDWKMEAARTARLLADAERIIAEYKAQAIEAARSSGADGVTAYERGFTDGVFVGREMPSKRIETLEAALLEIVALEQKIVKIEPASDRLAVTQSIACAALHDDDARARFLADRADTERKQANNPSSQPKPKD
jgi:hypothetical protein